MEATIEQRKERGGLEEYALVLDYLPTGKSFSIKSEPLAQLLGEEKFTLLEVSLKQGVIVKTGERVYIGRNERDKILQIKSRLKYNDLTEGAKKELPNAITSVIKSNEQKYINLFNIAGPLNIREHSLELLPGIGKKNLQAILAAREEKKFENFEDMSKRVVILQNPIKLLVDRIIEEMKGESRFYILTKPYPRDDEKRY